MVPNRSRGGRRVGIYGSLLYGRGDADGRADVTPDTIRTLANRLKSPEARLVFDAPPRWQDQLFDVPGIEAGGRCRIGGFVVERVRAPIRKRDRIQ